MIRAPERYQAMRVRSVAHPCRSAVFAPTNMNRRTLFHYAVSCIPLQAVRAWAQTAAFPGPHEAALQQLAATVLPESLGRAVTDAVAVQFVRWVREYRAGAEMQTGYGTTRVRYKPASPAPKYLEQLAALSTGAWAENGSAARRAAIAEALQAANVNNLPFTPDGTHVASDLMAFYFLSPAANDLAYQAAIGKDQCRTLKNSGSMPAPLKKEASNAAF